MTQAGTNRFSELAGGAGKQTLLKTNLRSQVDLVGITDQKANILLGLNTLIVSIIITMGGMQWFSESYSVENLHDELLPVIVLLVTSLISGLFALYAVWPKSVQKHNDEQLGILLLAKKYSQLNDYLDEMSQILKSNELTYKQIVTDIYTVSRFLVRKNLLLRRAYFVFFTGITLAVVLFIITIGS